MTEDQFEAIAYLARMRPTSKATAAAKMYILHSMRQQEIADRLQMAQPTVSQAVRRFIRAWKMARMI